MPEGLSIRHDFPEFQRDFVPKPRVARHELPWAKCRGPGGAKIPDFLTHLHQTLHAPSQDFLAIIK